MSQQQDRTAVRTYVPEHQSDVWREAADSMDMSLSEFVRSMVQAGRRGFDLDGTGADDYSSLEEPLSSPSNPRGRGLEDQVLATLESEGVADWGELVDKLSGDFEARLEDQRTRGSGGDSVRAAGGWLRPAG